jgi:hypothetical protein
MRARTKNICGAGGFERVVAESAAHSAQPFARFTLGAIVRELIRGLVVNRVPAFLTEKQRGERQSGSRR